MTITSLGYAGTIAPHAPCFAAFLAKQPAPWVPQTND